MSTPFLSEIRLFGFNFPPRGWALCNGQVLPINQNQALFSLLGTTYGGDGRVNFGLPNLQSRVPVHSNAADFALGQKGGEEAHTLLLSELPAHTHPVAASSNAPNQAGPGGHFWPNGGGAIPYADAPDTSMAPQAIQLAGGGQPHDNRPPYLVVNFCIALVGIFPSQT
jgi:microcystin-dependent protein